MAQCVAMKAHQHVPGNKLQSDDASRALYKRLSSSSSLKSVQFFYCKENLVQEVDEGKHDFLWLQLLNENDTHFILAEKHRDGIHIEWKSKAPTDRDERPQATIEATIVCEDNIMGLCDIEDTLEDFPDQYNIFTSNCKHYARAVGKKLIDALPTMSEKHKTREKKKIDDIPVLP